MLRRKGFLIFYTRNIRFPAKKKNLEFFWQRFPEDGKIIKKKLPEGNSIKIVRNPPKQSED
jgi:hypothetical protein